MKTKAKLRQSYLESQKLTDVRIMLKVADAFNAGYEACEQTYCFPKSATERPPEKQLYIPAPYVLINKLDDTDLEQQMAAFSAYMDECQRRILQLENSNSSNKLDGWISVKERLPEPNISVLVLFKNRITLAAIEDREDEFTESGTFRVWKALKLQQDDIYECYPWKAITHWMPLPKLPEEK